MDRIMAATGVAVLILAIVTGSVYASARQWMDRYRSSSAWEHSWTASR